MGDIKTKLESAVKFVWRYNPRKLTVHGMSYLLQDLIQLIASFMFIVGFPKASNEPMIQWLGAAGLLMIIVYVFMPSFFRLLMGNYEHYIEEDKAGCEEK